MLKTLIDSGELTMYQGWIEQALYNFLFNQLECKCHECRKKFSKNDVHFDFYFHNNNKNALRVDLIHDPSNR